MDLPKELRKLRLALGMAQEKMAALFNVSVSTIWRWEKRQRNIPNNLTAEVIRALVIISRRDGGLERLQDILELQTHRGLFYTIWKIVNLYFEENNGPSRRTA